MGCAACAARIEKALNRLDGVEATVNLATEQATVHCDRRCPATTPSWPPSTRPATAPGRRPATSTATEHVGACRDASSSRRR